jgi:hypothetical protein
MKRYLPAIVWLLAGVVLCIFFVQLSENTIGGELTQIFLLYGALGLGVLGLVTHTIVHREDNSSSVNFGYKLLAEGVVLLALIAAMLKEIFF